ncbi:MAG: exosortase/archaeosortase family protein [Candidatus Obscuribacterales bacterium]|nr:exosortase/archaeosortase family protein [Candidatus Obscuribacterales bacterium]
MLVASIFIVSFICGFWPVWQWFILRTLDPSDEPWGVIALLTVAVLIVGESRKYADFQPLLGKFHFALIIAGICFYIFSLIVFPHLVQAVLMIAVLSLFISVLCPQPSRTGILGLLILSLPIIPSLNFFIGYPLRLLITTAASFVLRTTGLVAVQDGTMLAINGHLVSVDAPCSGINMLWASGFLSCVCMCFYRLRFIQSLLLALATLVLIITANIFRVAGLSYFSAKSASFSAMVLELEPLLHTMAGVTAFVLVSLAVVFLARALQLRQVDSMKVQAVDGPVPVKSSVDLSVDFTAPSARPTKAQLGQFFAIAILLFIAALTPLLFHPKVHKHERSAVIWPQELNGHKLQELGAFTDKEDILFVDQFPGQIKQFSDGKRNYVLRWVTGETRQLHPSSDCFKGMGYKIEPGPIVVLEANQRWSSFIARRDKSNLRVLERVYDLQGKSWTDVSEWYWAATLGRSIGPWWDVVIAEPLD